MALNKDILGQAFYDAFDAFNNKLPNDIGDIEATRLAFCKVMANEIINHFKTAGVVEVTVSTTGTATAQTGTGSGTIT